MPDAKTTPTPLSEAEIAAIRAALEATTGETEGDWVDRKSSTSGKVVDFDDDPATGEYASVWGEDAGNNAAWIASSKANARRLLEHVQILESLLADRIRDDGAARELVMRGRRQMRAEAEEAVRFVNMQRAWDDAGIGTTEPRGSLLVASVLADIILALPDTPAEDRMP